MESIVWLIALVVLIAMEAATMGLVTIWFAGGALAAFLLSLFEVGWLAETIVFLIVSFLLLYFTRPVALRHFNNKRTKTNVESIIGKEARVLEEIDNFRGTGRAVLGGQEWTARSVKDELVISSGEKVAVKEIRGVKLIVEPVTAEQ